MVPINTDGELRVDEYDKLLGPRTKVVSIVHQSNALGTVNPIKDLVAKAEAFALGPYTVALAKGLSLPEAELKSVAAEAAKDDILELAKAEPNVLKHMEGKTVRKEIVVPQKLVNIVVG